MSKWKSPYNDDRIVPLVGQGNGRIVKPEEVITVPDALDVEFEAAGWEPVTPVIPMAISKDGE